MQLQKWMRMCRIWHRWRLVKNTGANEYYQCKDCSARSVRVKGNGYQPINHDWLNGVEKN